ncbi:MAG: fluoride efflux transporter CrcB [Pseudomonadota bacterium]
MKAWLWVGLGGAVGAVLRYQIARWTLAASEHERFPLGTLLVNALGCLAVGVLWAVLDRAQTGHDTLRLTLMVGLLGGFTTFSAFGLETVLMLKRGDAGLALLYVAVSVLVGLLGVWLGLSLGRGGG